MFIAVFVVAVIISAFFDQQERRHKLELEIEYERLGRRMPEFPPKLQMLESTANIVVGSILLWIGSVGLVSFLFVIRDAWMVASKFDMWGEVDFISAILAGGIALVILGVKSLAANLRYRKEHPPSSDGIKTSV